jgi:SAM-dependent methyltransferase
MPRSQGELAEPQVSPDEYDEAYYRTMCAGYEAWEDGSGAWGLYPAMLRRAGVTRDMTVLDVGAGRGELVALAAEQGVRWAVGIEYSPAATALSKQTFDKHAPAGPGVVVLADARRIPLPDNCVDRAFMLDVVEHLAPDELAEALAEIYRVLRPGGRLIAHTFPTRTIYTVTYRLLRGCWPSHLRHWPADPRNDFEHRMHVNEQTLRSLRRALRRAGFGRPAVTRGEWVYTDFVPSPRWQKVVRGLGRFRLTAALGVADLWAEAAK